MDPNHYAKLDTGLLHYGLPYGRGLSVMQALAYNHALAWLAKQDPTPMTPTPPIDPKLKSLGEEMTANFVKSLTSMLPACTCAAASGVIGHADFCPLGERAESDAANFTDPQELPA